MPSRGSTASLTPWLSAGNVSDPGRLEAINGALQAFEGSFIDSRGLPGRPWYRHVVLAPGTVTGYAAWPLPGLTQAVRDRDASMLDGQSARLMEALDRALGVVEDGLRSMGRARR